MTRRCVSLGTAAAGLALAALAAPAVVWAARDLRLQRAVHVPEHWGAQECDEDSFSIPEVASDGRLYVHVINNRNTVEWEVDDWPDVCGPVGYSDPPVADAAGKAATTATATPTASRSTAPGRAHAATVS